MHIILVITFLNNVLVTSACPYAALYILPRHAPNWIVAFWWDQQYPCCRDLCMDRWHCILPCWCQHDNQFWTELCHRSLIRVLCVVRLRFSCFLCMDCIRSQIELSLIGYPNNDILSQRLPTQRQMLQLFSYYQKDKTIYESTGCFAERF